MDLGLKKDQVLRHPLFQGVPRETLNLFRAYHHANPNIFAEFLKLSYRLMDLGFKHYGAKCILENVRYHIDLKQGAKGDGTGFKLNNDFFSYYARLAAVYDSRFMEFFNFRKTEGLRRAA